MAVSPSFRTFVLHQLGRVAPRGLQPTGLRGARDGSVPAVRCPVGKSCHTTKSPRTCSRTSKPWGIGPTKPSPSRRATGSARDGAASSRHQRVDLVPPLLQPVGDLLARGFVPRPPARPVDRLHQPADGAVHVGHRTAQRALHGVVHTLEDVVHDILVLLEERASRVRDLVDLLSRHVAGRDEPFIFEPDRKSTRLNSSHGYISYAVFCLKKKKKLHTRTICRSAHVQ